jgi:hypothetical protein
MADIQEMLRREVAQAMVDGAAADKVSLDADALSICSQPELFVASAPVADVEGIDFKSLLDGRSNLDGKPIMYWYLAGASLRDKAVPLDEGFYTVVADQSGATVSLRNTKGDVAAHGDLEIFVEPQEPTIVEIKVGVSGKISSFDVKTKGKDKHIKVCGEVSVEVGPAKGSIKGCVEISW